MICGIWTGEMYVWQLFVHNSHTYSPRHPGNGLSTESGGSDVDSNQTKPENVCHRLPQKTKTTILRVERRGEMVIVDHPQLGVASTQ